MWCYNELFGLYYCVAKIRGTEKFSEGCEIEARCKSGIGILFECR